MTPAEFDLLLQGYQYRQERDMRRTAWVLANILNALPWMKEPVTIDGLLGVAPSKPRKKPAMTKRGWGNLLKQFGF